MLYINQWLSWSWSYGSSSWIYNYLCNQCLSQQKLWVQIPLMARCVVYISQFCHFIYVWLVWNNADVEIKFIIQFYLFIIYWTIVDCHICVFIICKTKQRIWKGFIWYKQTKNKYKDICKSERWYANKNKELNNYWIYLNA
jgi:hypothetical protein